MPCSEFANTSTSRGNATLRTSAALPTREFMPVFVTSIRKFHGSSAHSRYSANERTSLWTPFGASAPNRWPNTNE